MVYLWSIFFALLIIFVYDYNKLIRLNQQTNEGWSGIDVQLKRRRDLIPELLKIAENYAKHEKDVYKEIAALRQKAEDAENVETLALTETKISTGLQKVFALVEAYPDLKADRQYKKLQDTLVAVESDLEKARRYYNAAVREYNVAVCMFPELIVANAMDYREKAFFELSTDSK